MSLIRRSLMAPLVIGLVCGPVGCGTSRSAGPATARGTVLDDASLQPVAGVTVSIAGNCDTTGADGTFSVATRAGLRTLALDAAGYQQGRIDVMLGGGDNQIGIIYLKPALRVGLGAVEGVVRLSGAGIGGALIRCGDAVATSKDDGTFAIYNIEAGTRAIVAVSEDGNSAGCATATVTAGDTATGTQITLGLAPPDPPDHL